ncbi:hypothetical protein GCM10011323_10240 [Pontibacter amylolyticus]|uniref:Uncharacterized protein n=1 Tax=Pontibacter amylolyticus TaxID=1424080 RepID=A0ABQ1W161_9BACT|nr:hypothetical protein GCM10011323_10240 [Pontibacter amylolyticus]
MLVPVFVAGLLAKGIARNAVRAGDTVHQPMLLKGVQGAVQRDPVKLWAELLFYGSVRQGVSVLKKQTKHLYTALRLPKPVGLE